MKNSGEEVDVTIGDEILQWIEDEKSKSVPVTNDSHLYTDLGFDSLSFIRFLMDIEDHYAITFEITEMELCLHVGTLIDRVENKVRERNTK